MNLAPPPTFGVLGLVVGSPRETVFPHVLIGATVRGRYRLDAVIHEGAGAVVFRATHLGNGRPIALKIRAPEATPEHSRAFERAATLGADLEHGRLPRILDRGETEDGLSFLVMEWLEGAPLSAYPSKLEPTRVVKLIAQVLHGLRYLHAREITHGNLGPNNLFLNEAKDGEGQMKILDLGRAVIGGSSGSITMSDLLVGTPGYIAPEQITGGDFDHRADLYALGVVFYELLVGASPWPTQDPEKLLDHQIGHSIPALPSSLAAFDPLVQRLGARDPTDRFPSAAAALEALEDCVLGSSTRRRTVVTDELASSPPRPSMFARKSIIITVALGLTSIVAAVGISRFTAEAEPPPAASAVAPRAAESPPSVASIPASVVPAPSSPAASIASSTRTEGTSPDDVRPEAAATAEVELQPAADASTPQRASAATKRRRSPRDASRSNEPIATEEPTTAPPVDSPAPAKPATSSVLSAPATPAVAEPDGLLEAPTRRGPSSDVLLGG